MGDFEQAFGEVERAAASTAKSATDLGKLAKALEKAAKTGNIAAVRREQAKLSNALNALQQETVNAVESWPFQESAEEEYLRNGYAAELRSIAGEKGLRIFEQDGRLISSPSVIHVLPGSKAVRIDQKRTPHIRPSHLAEFLRKNQQTPSRFQLSRFLEALYQTYQLVTGTPPLSGDWQGTAPLEKIYMAFTSLPGSNLEYSKMDFARDIYRLDSEGPQKTRSGMNVDFPTSTGARSAKGVFSFVDPRGQTIAYYGIRFSRDE